LGKIVAVGGGDIRSNDSYPIDRFIVGFAQKPKPRVLFIPTASKDRLGDWVYKRYKSELNCDVDTLMLLKDLNIKEVEISNKVLNADIIYVCGGDTSMMMSVWRSRNLDRLLIEAYKRNIVMAGMSAGSICWFTKGYSDIGHDNINPVRRFKLINGLGVLPFIHCPHYNEEQRKSFDQIMEKQDMPGVAIEDNCAFVIYNDKYKIINCKNEKAYLLYKKNDILLKDILNINIENNLSDIIVN